MADPAVRKAALARAGRALQELGGALLELAEEAPAPAEPRPPRESTRAMVGRVRPTDVEVAAARRELRRKGVHLEDETE